VVIDIQFFGASSAADGDCGATPCVFHQSVGGAGNVTLPRRRVLCQTNLGHLQKENGIEHWEWARESRAGIF
jgi:hypothetical protein